MVFFRTLEIFIPNASSTQLMERRVLLGFKYQDHRVRRLGCCPVVRNTEISMVLGPEARIFRYLDPLTSNLVCSIAFHISSASGIPKNGSSHAVPHPHYPEHNLYLIQELILRGSRSLQGRIRSLLGLPTPKKAHRVEPYKSGGFRFIDPTDRVLGPKYYDTNGIWP